MNQEEIKKIIEGIFAHSGCSISSFEFIDEKGALWCMIQTPDSRFMIGRDGETLQALNHIVRLIVDKNTEEGNSKFFIDINGYQKKHFDNLKTQAHMLAQRARYFKSNIETDPMPSYDRRIIHLFLEDLDDIKTESTGVGKERRVVIKYINQE